MRDDIIQEWSFDITQPAEVSDSLSAGDAPVGDVRIITPEDDASEQVYREDSLFGIHLAAYARVIPSVLSGEALTVEVDASDIQFTPLDNRDAIEVYVKMHGVPDTARGYTPDLIATSAFCEEVYNTCLEWYKEAKRLEPELSQEEWFTDLEDSLYSAHRAIRNADFSMDLENPS